MTKKPSLALIGAGAMGGALLRGWLQSGSIDAGKSAVFDPGVSDDVADTARKAGIAVNIDGAGAFDALVFAVKPQMAENVLPDFAAMASDAVVVSVMAGKSAAAISSALSGAPKIIRAMPNLPASIGVGATGLFATSAVSDSERAMADILMQTVGETVWVGEETHIDLITAISGSGPAYFFLLAEALEEAGGAMGLKPEAAARLARATLAGAGALVGADARGLADLRKAVTSPGGTTAAALGVLDGGDKAVRRIVAKAVAAAAKRAAELSD